MNEHSIRILSRVSVYLEEYRTKVITLSKLINILEGSIDALEEKLPQEWISKWNESVGNLETYSALGLENARSSSIIDNLDQLERLLSEIIRLDSNGNCDNA